MHIKKHNFPNLKISLLANSDWFPDFVNTCTIIRNFITLHKYVNTPKIT